MAKIAGRLEYLISVFENSSHIAQSKAKTT